MRTFSTAFRGDDVYKRALKAFALASGKQISDLTRDAFEKVYGESMKPYIQFFDTLNVNQNEQNAIQVDNIAPLDQIAVAQ